MKDFLLKSLKYFLYAVLAALLVWGIVGGSIEGITSIVSFFKELGNGSAFLGIILSPFWVFGALQAMRGVFEIISKDSEKFKSYSVFTCYVAATLIGLIVFASYMF